MAKRMMAGMSARGWLLGMAVAAFATPSWAFGVVQADSAYLQLLAINFSSLGDATFSLQGPSVTWQCTGTAAGDCSFTGSLTASLIVQPPAANLVPADTWSYGTQNMQMLVIGKAPVALLDPNGHTYGYFQADLGKWTLTASGTVGSPPANPLFMTAYGTNTVSASDGTANYGGQKQLLGAMTTQVSTTIGPGAAGAPALEASRSFSFNQSLITPYFAYPSTTDPRCSSLSCLDYAAGVYTPNSYVLSFDLVGAPTPAVPEPGTVWLALAGLGAMGWSMRRRA